MYADFSLRLLRIDHDCHSDVRLTSIYVVRRAGSWVKMDVSKGVPKYGYTYANSPLAVTYGSQVSGHEDDDHQCAAVTHACGEVIVTFHLSQYYILYLTFLAM